MAAEKTEAAKVAAETTTMMHEAAAVSAHLI